MWPLAFNRQQNEGKNSMAGKQVILKTHVGLMFLIDHQLTPIILVFVGPFAAFWDVYILHVQVRLAQHGDPPIR